MTPSRHVFSRWRERSMTNRGIWRTVNAMPSLTGWTFIIIQACILPIAFSQFGGYYPYYNSSTTTETTSYPWTSNPTTDSADYVDYPDMNDPCMESTIMDECIVKQSVHNDPARRLHICRNFDFGKLRTCLRVRSEWCDNDRELIREIREKYLDLEEKCATFLHPQDRDDWPGFGRDGREKKKESALSLGVIVGIAIGGLVILVIVIAVVTMLCMKRTKNHRRPMSPAVRLPSNLPSAPSKPSTRYTESLRKDHKGERPARGEQRKEPAKRVKSKEDEEWDAAYVVPVADRSVFRSYPNLEYEEAEGVGAAGPGGEVDNVYEHLDRGEELYEEIDERNVSLPTRKAKK